MGDFFDNAVIFLEEYYVYVIGVGLIIILMLIGFLASRRKARKDSNQNGSMANINEVNTGSINDVASTLQDNNVTSVTDVKLPDNNAIVTPQPVITDSEETEVLETEPAANGWDSFVNPAIPEVEQSTSPVADNNSPASPFAEEANADSEDKFNKTEIIDFSSLSRPEPMTDINPISPMMGENKNEPITVGTINQTVDTAERAPVTDININEPTLIQTVNPMPANESITEAKVSPAVEEVENEPITDIRPSENNSFVIDKSQYTDILNGEASSSQESKM